MADDTRNRPKPAGLGEFLFNEFRQAVQDIRQKAVEQGWFGRVTTPKPVVEMPFQAVESARSEAPELAPERRPSFEEQWASRAQSIQPAEQARDIGIDR